MSSELQKRLRQLREHFASELPAKLTQLNELWIQARKDACPESYATLQGACHKLAGSSGTFGFDALGNSTRHLEQLLEPAVEGAPASEALLEQLQELIDKLPGYATLEPVVDDAVSAWRQPLTPLALRPVYVVDDDAFQRATIAATLEDNNYEVISCHSLAELKKQLSQRDPGAIIMDLAFPEGPMAGSELIAQFKKDRLLQIPVLFISSHNNVYARLEAVRAGGDAYFPKPLDISALSERLDYLVAKGKIDPYRVLVIDDDEFQAQYHADILQGAGLEVARLSKPLQILEMMAEFKPELLLLDLHMPECSGVELANMLRQHRAYEDVPIVFLSAESDVKRHFEARLVGADDFLVKPIEDHLLVASVVNRVQRARSLQQQVTRDSMTSLLNHEKLLEELHREVSRADRQGTPMSYCMLDIDNFKQVNDTYGHSVGDSVIKSFADLLKRRLRRTDIVGRYGGEEFGVVMVGSGIEEALQVADSIRSDFEVIEHHSGTERFCVTVSAGIAESCDFPDRQALVEAADKALYTAKSGGRNQVCVNTSAC